jgi:hypothetical protein
LLAKLKSNLVLAQLKNNLVLAKLKRNLLLAKLKSNLKTKKKQAGTCPAGKQAGDGLVLMPTQVEKGWYLMAQLDVKAGQNGLGKTRRIWPKKITSSIG